jgi:hypothetical protein
MAKQHTVLEALVWGLSCWTTWPMAFHQQDLSHPTDNHPDLVKVIAMLQAAIY